MNSYFETFTLRIAFVSGTISYIQKSDFPWASSSVSIALKSLGRSFVAEYGLVTRFPERLQI
jgi:hypothetical protein